MAKRADISVSQYRPRTLDDLHYHKELSARLASLVRGHSNLKTRGSRVADASFTQAATGDFPHMLFYGPSGAGKKTRIACVLRELFGPGVEKVRARKDH